MKFILTCCLFFFFLISVHAQLSFTIDTIYFKNAEVKKVSVAPDGLVWSINGSSNIGIGLITGNGSQLNMTQYISSATSANFTSIQSVDNGFVFVGTNSDYLYGMNSNGNLVKFDPSSGILDKTINSIVFAKFNHTIGYSILDPLDHFYNPKFMVVATTQNMFITDDFINFKIFSYYPYRNYDVHYAEKDYLETTVYTDVTNSPAIIYEDHLTNSEFLSASESYYYDSSYYNSGTLSKINASLINYININASISITKYSFLYWADKQGLKKRTISEDYTPYATLLDNQEVYSIKIAPYRTQVKDTIISYDTVRYHAKKDVLIDRYLFAGSDSGFYYGKALFNYAYRTDKDSMQKVILPNTHFTKVYDIGIDTSGCGYLWLATDNGLYKVRTNFQKEIIYNSIQPQGRINICDRTINLNATLQNNSTVQWQRDSVDIPSATNLQYQTTVPGSYRYRINNNITTDCFSKPVTLVRDTSIVYNYPNINQSICKGDTFTLKVKADTGYVYAWYRSNLFTGFTDTLIKPIIDGWYKAKVTNCYKMSAFSDSTLLTLSTISKPPLFVSKNPICTDDTTQLYITSTGYNTLWQRNGINDTTLANKTTITGLPYYAYQVTIKDIINCTATSDKVLITGIAYPSLSLIPNSTETLCTGSVLILQADTDANQLFWSTNTNTPSITINQGGDYMVKAWFDPLCKTVDSVRIVEVDSPTFKLKSDTVFCFGELNPVELKAPSGFKTYQWNEYKTTSNIFSINNAGLVSLEITDVNNCTVSSTINIQDKCRNLVVPNIFTPNGDGTNDVFEIKNIIPNMQLSVFNRWGSLVYSSDNYDNNWAAGGLSDGLYFYSLYDSFYKNEYKGWLEVAR